MTQPTTIRRVLVAGATGGTGRQIVAELYRQGLPQRALVRDAAQAAGLTAYGAELAVGDTTRPETLSTALQGMSAVICATGTRTPEGPNNPAAVDAQGVANLVAAARQAGVEHFVLISTIAATRPDHPLNRFGGVLDAKLAGENSLRASGLPYTIIRPGGLRDDAGGAPLLFAQGDTMSGLVSRADVALVAVAALRLPTARGKTFELINDEQGTHDLAAAFAELAIAKS